MSQCITFEGASDDIAIVIVDGAVEEYDAYHGAQFHLVARTGRLQITLDLNDESGCWSIGIGQTDDAHPVAAWPIAVAPSPDCDHSARVTITAPADARLVQTR
ncbi:hypothetical protein ACWEQ4_00835 [Rhodococcus sp. NPDC003994]